MNSNQPFDVIATEYDLQFSDTKVGKTQRELVWGFLRKIINESNTRTVLELNCGTGIDARWLAENGLEVLATDISSKMVEVAKNQSVGFNGVLFLESDIQDIIEKTNGRSFDLILSDFGGLNCISPQSFELFLSQSLPKLLNPNGKVVLVIMPKFCLIESVYFLIKMQFSNVFRRNTNHAVSANLDSKTSINIWYYSPAFIQKNLPKNLKISHLQPIGFFIPPSYLNSLIEKRPQLLDFLKKLENWAIKIPFLANFSDHFLIEISREA